MKDYLHALKNVHQSIDDLLVKSENSSEIQQFTDYFSKSLEPCFDEIQQSSTKLKQLIETCLKELEDTEELWNNQPTLSETDYNQTMEEIGRLAGCSFKVTEAVKKYQVTIIETLKSAWQKDFKELNDKWFMNESGKSKQGIGWKEKESYITGVKTIKDHQVQRFEELLKKLFQLIRGNINDIIDFNQFKQDLKSLDKKTGEKYLQVVVSALNKINNSLSTEAPYSQYFETQVLAKLDVITNQPLVEFSWNNLTNRELPKAELTWEEVNNSNSEYLEQLELVVDEIFDQQSKLIQIFVDSLMKFYNDFLEKQQYYKTESQEQKELKYQWLETQKHELSKIKQSLDEVLSSFEVKS